MRKWSIFFIILLTLIIVCLVIFSVIGFSTTRTVPKQINFNNSSDNFCIQNPTKCNSSSDCKKCSESGEIEFECQQANSKDKQTYCLPKKPTMKCNSEYGGVMEWTGWNATETSDWECKCQFPNIAGGDGCELNSNVCNSGTFTFNKDTNEMTCECPDTLQLVYTKGDNGDAIPMCVNKGSKNYVMCGNKERCNNFYGNDTQYLRYLTKDDVTPNVSVDGNILYDGPKLADNTQYTSDNTNILDLQQAEFVCTQRFGDNSKVVLSDSCNCSNISEQDKCIGECSWDKDKKSCKNRTACSSLDDENSCKNNKQCSWDGKQCNSLTNAKNPVFKCSYKKGDTVVESDCQTFDYRRLDGVCRTADFQYPYYRMGGKNTYSECLENKDCIAWNKYGPNANPTYQFFYDKDDKKPGMNKPSPNWIPGSPIVRGDKNVPGYTNASCYIKY